MTDLIFDELFKKAYSYSKQRLIQLTGSSSIAKELFVKAITKYWMKNQKGELPEIKYVEKYVYMIARNDWYDQKKKKNKEEISNPIELDTYSGKRLDIFNETEFNNLIKQENTDALEKEKKEKDVCLKRAFNKLGSGCKKLLTAAITYNKNNKELQKELGYQSIDVVKATKYRCKKYLKGFYLQEYKKIKGTNE